MAEKNSPRRGLSLRSSRKKETDGNIAKGRDVTPKTKTINYIDSITPKRNPVKRLNCNKEASPKTPKVATSARSTSKTPNSRIKLIKSLYKSKISPICSSQVAPECEVEWDCDSPGFSKADLKRKHKKDVDYVVEEPSPMPHRMLFARQQAVCSETEEKNFPILSDELDKLLRTNSSDAMLDIADSNSPHSSNGFIGFGTNFSKTADTKLKTPDFTDESLDDTDLFTDSLLEATQTLENAIYKNNKPMKSPSESGLAKNIFNLTTSTLISPKDSVCKAKSIKNYFHKGLSKSSTPNNALKRLISTSDDKSAKRPDSYTSFVNMPKPTRVSSFKTYRSSFSLNPTTTEERCASDRNGKIVREPQRFGGPADTKKPHCPPNKFNDTTSIKNVQPPVSQLITIKCNIKNDSKNCCNSFKSTRETWSPRGLATKSKTVSDFSPSLKVSSDKGADCLDTRNKMSSMQMFSDEDDSMFASVISNLEEIEKQSITKSTSLKFTGNKPSVDVLMDDIDDDLFGTEAIKMLTQIEKTKQSEEVSMEDDDAELFGSETLDIVTEVEKSAMMEGTQAGIIKLNQSIHASTLATKPVSVVPLYSASFKQSNQPFSCVEKIFSQTTPSCMVTRRISQALPRRPAQPVLPTPNTTTTLQPIGRPTRVVRPTGYSYKTEIPIRHTLQGVHSTAQPNQVLHSVKSLQGTGHPVYSKEEIALKKEEAIKRRANRAKPRNIT